MKAYILLKIQAGEVGEALRQMRQAQGVTAADMTFGPYDAVAVVETSDLNHLGHIVAWNIQTIPGVTQSLTCLAVDIG